ncbi:MAG: hypothetical protein KatS3mg131_2316 [Candidatus Tectimicrobiota bacterium]|nr:MAG: hypothetical protein KatS3mg131_2316 [Candidatus Tectomicrobia bacterium]
MRTVVLVLCLGLLALPVQADEFTEAVAKLGLSKEELVEIGKLVYHAEGKNTCLYCHGEGGHGGNQAGAADLRHPKTWRAYQALGGDEAFKANKEEFLSKMETALHYLIRYGAVVFNTRWEKRLKDMGIHYDWSKVTVPDKADKYNNMMKGITTGPMKKQLDEVEKLLEKKGKKVKDVRDIATVAALEYVKTLDDGSDKGGVFKSDP